MIRTRHVLGSLLVVASLSRSAAADPAVEASARAAFEAHVALGHEYDAAAADFYADDATIRNLRRDSAGRTRELGLTGSQYKELIRKAMPLAKARGDKSDYRQCIYKAEGEVVRVDCQRYSHLKLYTSPYRAVLKKGPAGVWLVDDEYSESQP